MGDPARDLCLRLLEETIERIRADRERASVRVAEMLGVMEEHLLHPDFDVNALLRECGQRDPNVSTRFAAELGLGPDAYRRELRMELAGRMLVASDVQVWRIGVQVGYLTPGSFSRAFKKWSGKTPGTFREAARSGVAEPAPAPEELLSIDELYRAVDGDLPPERAEALAGRLYDLGDRICADYERQGPARQDPAADGTVAVESAMARSLWKYIEPLPYELQMGAIESQGPHYRTQVLFNRLCTVSVEAKDDFRAFQLASLALAALHAMGDRVGDDYVNAFARAWAVYGYAHRRVGNLDEAARYLDQAADLLAMAGDEAHPVVVAELCFYQATLEIERDDFEEAEKLSEKGQEILRRVKEQVRAEVGDALDWEAIEGGEADGAEG